MEEKGKLLPEFNEKPSSNYRTKTANTDLSGKKSADFTRNRNFGVRLQTNKKESEEGFDKNSFIYRTTIGNALGTKYGKGVVQQKSAKLAIPSEQLKKLKVSLMGVEGIAYHSRNMIPAKTTIKEKNVMQAPPHKAQAHRNYGAKRAYVSSLLRQSVSIKK